MKSAVKEVLFLIFKTLYFFQLGYFFYKKLWGNSFIRAVNYHATPSGFVDGFEEQLKFYKKYFCVVGLQELNDLLEGQWRQTKPGILISFDDGLRSQYLVAAPLLEKYGFVGWFFMPAGLIEACADISVENQKAFAKEHQIAALGIEENDVPRAFMTWDEIRDLQKNHVVGCHTMTHRRLKSDSTHEVLNLEISEAKSLMEANLGGQVDSFCWVGGEEESYSHEAAKAIQQAGFRYGFMTNVCPIHPKTNPLMIQRTNIEAHWSMRRVEFYLSGAMDLYYHSKRSRVIKITQANHKTP